MGDNIWLEDRDGVRTPMQWTPGHNAGFSPAESGKLYLPVIDSLVFNSQAVNVESQLAQPNSLLQWVRQILSVRRQYPVFGNGSFVLHATDHDEVLAFTRSNSEQTVLCLMNLSEHPVATTISLPDYAGWHATEITGGSNFPDITVGFPVTLPARGFFWIALTPP